MAQSFRKRSSITFSGSGVSGFRPALSRRRKASTILLVLSILSLLILLSIMMTFTSRLEQAAAGNFARGMQDRSASLTGLPALLPVFPLVIPPGPTSPLDLAMNQDMIEFRYESLDGGYSPFAVLEQERQKLLSGTQSHSASGTRGPVFSANRPSANNGNSGDFLTVIDDSRNPARRPDSRDDSDSSNLSDFRNNLGSNISSSSSTDVLEVNDLATGFGGPLGVMGSDGLFPEVITPTAEVFLLDASALININTASYDHLVETLRIAAREFGHSYNPEALASAIVTRRLGPDGAPGHAGVDDDFDADKAISPGDTFEDSERRSLAGTFSNSSDLYYEALSPRRQQAVEEALEGVREPLGLYTKAETEARHQARLSLLSGVDEYDEYVADIRRPAYGDDQRIHDLMELLDLSRSSETPPAPVTNANNPGSSTGGRNQFSAPVTATTAVEQVAGLTPEVVKDLSQVFTVFSASTRERVVDGQVLPLLDINRATAEEIYRGLKALYGDNTKNEQLLRQFAVNIVDARDTDSVPTRFPGFDSASSQILGVERTPFITEVYADSRTPVEYGDDGQYVEIYNPWPEPIRLSGWRLSGAGVNVQLNGQIPPLGYLIVTDDVDGSVLENEEEDLPGTGSFYDIFGILPDGNRRQVSVSASMSLVDQGSNMAVVLENENGDAVDVFRWSSNSQDEDSLYSYQRYNPVIREAVRATATPFNRLSDAGLDPEALERLAQGPQNGPFVSIADVLTVFAGFSDPVRQARAADAFPVIGTPDSPDGTIAQAAQRRDRLDARLLDLFAIYESDLSASAENSTANRLTSSTGNQASSAPSRSKNEGRPLVMTQQERFEMQFGDDNIPRNLDAAKTLAPEEDLLKYLEGESSGVSAQTQFGRLNLNTAGPLALESLPGIDQQTALRLVARRDEMIARARRGDMNDAILFHELSDLLEDEDLMGSARNDAERLLVLRQLLPHITLSSQTFQVITQPRISPDTPAQSQMAKRLQGLVTIDRMVAEIVTLREKY